MKWLVVGTDREGRRRQVDYEVETEAEGRARVEAEGWQDVEFAGPNLVGQVVADDLVSDELSPAEQEAVSLATPEPSALKRFFLSVPATYLGIWPVVAGLGLGLIANLWFGGPTWLSAILSGALTLPAVLTAIGGRRVGWYSDYRWAVAKGDWPIAMDRAAKLSGAMEESLGMSMLARALAGAGKVEAAREIMQKVTVHEGFNRTNYLVHSGFVLTEAGDYEAALQTQIALMEEMDDVPTAAQGVASCYAIYFQDGPSARPYLEQAQSLRGRGKQVDFYVDATEAFVRVEEGETSTVLPLFDELLPLAEVYCASVPEMWHLKALLQAYACLASAPSDPARAAQHFEQASRILAAKGPEHLHQRCLQALTSKP